MRSTRIAVDARLRSGSAGGVEQFITGLASALSQLTDGDEEYLFLAYEDSADWVESHISGPCELLPVPGPSRRPLSPSVKALAPKLNRIWLRSTSLPDVPSCALPQSDGTIERAQIDVMHFTTQNGFVTGIPTLYQPWDLQHLHLPQFFSPRLRWARDQVYRAFCAQAELVLVTSHWGKQDIIQHYGLAPGKIAVIAGAPILAAYPTPSDEDLCRIRRRFDLPESFLYYPAQTWPHKNHLGLLAGLAILRDQYGSTVPLVCSGRRTDFYPHIERRARDLGLALQIRFLGYVSELEVRSLYRLSRAVVFPTIFEGLGMPLLEAFWAQVPIACSNVTSLPEYAGGAALLFDPQAPKEIAESVRRLWVDPGLRRQLIERGSARVAKYSWQHTARVVRAHYRRIAGCSVSDEDYALLNPEKEDAK